MVVWQITGDDIGPDGNNAAYFATKSNAERAISEYKRYRRESGKTALASGPDKIVVNSREDLARELNSAMGYGVS